MAKVLPGATDIDKLHALCELSYKEQAVWFLNAYWEQFADKEAERLWAYVHKCAEIDLQRGKDGNGLDELQAHVFLEKFDETLTVRDMRTRLRETGAMTENERPKLVPLTHYLLFKYSVNWHELVHASQGDNSKEIAEAQRKLDSVQAAFAESDARAREAAEALRESTRTEAEAKRREETARAAEEEALAREAAAKEQEAPFKAAQEELEAALAELKAQEDAYNAKKDELTRKKEEGSVVQRNKAANELAQLLAEDPLPLRRAKITAEAAFKKAEKARAPFEAATKQAVAAREVASAAANEASQARSAAENARKASENAKLAADHALEEAAARVAEAEAFLEELKSRPGSAHGSMWWMERELYEAKKFLPVSKGGIAK